MYFIVCIVICTLYFMFFVVYLCLYQQTPSTNKSLEKPVGFTGGPSQLTVIFFPLSDMLIICLLAIMQIKKSSPRLPSWQSLIFFNTPIDSESIIKPCTLKLFQVPILAPAPSNEMFTMTNCPYDFRDNSILESPKSNTTKYGLKSFRNYGAKIWTLLPNDYKLAVSLRDFENVIKSWNGPNCKCSVCSIN